MTKVYMVLSEGWESTTCFGIYSTPKKAYARETEVAPHDRYVRVEEIDLDDDMSWTI